MKHKIIYKTIFVALLLLTLSSCKKDDDPSSPNGGGNNGPIPTSLVGTWECANLPTQTLRDKYDKFIFTVSSSDAYSLKYHNKDGSVTEFTGKVVVFDPDEKHTNGQPIMNININVTHINGNPSPGGWKGIYAFEAGNVLRLNIEPNIGGIQGPVARDGFGSGASGKDGVFVYVKQ